MFLSKGGYLMLPILICSAVSLTLVLERAWFFFKTRNRKSGLTCKVKSLLHSGDLEAARDFCGNKDCFLSFFLKAGIKAKKSQLNEKQMLKRAGSIQIEQGQMRIRALNVIANTATLLGLLGTVVGMIRTFIMIEASGSSPDVSVLAGGIWEALMTTAAGLSVAIPSIVFYHFFESIVDARELCLKNAASDVFGVY